MSRIILATLAVAGLMACGDRSKQDTAAADSLNRDLQLPPVDTSAKLNDRPSAPPAPTSMDRPTTPSRTPPRRPANAPSSAPNSAAAAPTPAPVSGKSLAAGASIVATTTAEIRSNKNKVGDEIPATVAKDVTNSAGAVVIPAGSTVTLKVTAIKVSENKSDSTGTLTVQPTAVTINGNSQPVSASIQGVNTHLEGRKTGAGDVAKVGGGAAAGAVVGRVLGGSGKGAIIGGIIGGAVGAQRAVETKDRDVVLPQGTTVTMTLNESFTSAH